jgi:hypothetical protein
MGLLGCQPDNPKPSKTLKINKLSENKEGSGSEVIIYGEGFADFPTNNVIKFGNEIAAIVSGNKSQIITHIPAGVRKGKIKLSISSLKQLLYLLLHL